MKTVKFNVFNQIHKALRALLFDTVTAVQRTDMADANAAKPVIAQVLLLLDLFDAHADHEDRFILSGAEHLDPALIHTFEAEHEEDLRLTEALREKVRNYNMSQTPESRWEVGNLVYYALNDFVAFNLQHMNKEERQLNEFLWANYTNEEIMEMEVKLQQAIPQEKLFTYFIWMIKGINDTELATWIRAVRNGAPDFIFQALLAECEKHLEKSRFELLKNRINDLVSTI